jgi:DNA-binding NarL/FixJ family response regulator
MSRKDDELGRQRKVGYLLTQCYSNADMAKDLGVSRRTIKSDMNKLFIRYGITSGVKRVKLAVALFREQQNERKS